VSCRIEARFTAAQEAGRKVLIPFMTAGDPDPDWTVPIMHSLVEGGADLLELGVPFSDPTADGPVIQAASERAIRRGVGLSAVLGMVAAFRKRDDTTPVVLMGYMNPIERFGVSEHAPAAAAAGVDGFLLVDAPPEESGKLQDLLKGQGIDTIRLVAPTTTPKRLKGICRSATGFIYYVSFKGITGADRLDIGALAAPIAAVRGVTDLPVVAGFGISDPQSAQAAAAHADGVVIGSALVRLLADTQNLTDARDRAQGFVASVREAMENSST
jgi:tryptophan synthase alpha chain